MGDIGKCGSVPPPQYLTRGVLGNLQQKLSLWQSFSSNLGLYFKPGPLVFKNRGNENIKDDFLPLLHHKYSWILLSQLY
jgi:hypothetical protein